MTIWLVVLICYIRCDVEKSRVSCDLSCNVKKTPTSLDFSLKFHEEVCYKNRNRIL